MRAALSQAVRSLRRVCLFPLMFSPCFSRKSFMKWLTNLSPKFSPPGRASPASGTLKTPASTAGTLTSKVRPPRSKTSTFGSLAPRVSAGWRGRLMIRSRLRPAMAPASLVGWRCGVVEAGGHGDRGVPPPPRAGPGARRLSPYPGPAPWTRPPRGSKPCPTRGRTRAPRPCRPRSPPGRAGDSGRVHLSAREPARHQPRAVHPGGARSSRLPAPSWRGVGEGHVARRPSHAGSGKAT